MLRSVLCSPFIALLLFVCPSASFAQPQFVNGLRIPGSTLDASNEPGANAGRLGHFSDIYYDPNRHEWWALSDRGPGGGLIDYATRVQRFDVDVHPITGRISNFRIKDTIRFRDRFGFLLRPTAPVGDPLALNGLNPALLNLDPALPGRTFDPEGLVIDPRTGHFLVADEYLPALYEFGRNGWLMGVFAVPDNLIPRPAGPLDYVAGRDGGSSGSGRQDNRGYEGLAVSPDGKRLFAVLQDPLLDEGPRSNATDATDNDGRDGRNVRIIVFDNDWWSPRYRQSIAQYVYQLEPQLAIRNRILAAGGSASATDPRQGRNIGLSAIVASNDHEFLVLERDNRGIGVDNPAGRGNGVDPVPPLGIVGSKRVYKIDITGATNVSHESPPDDGNLAAVGIIPVQKNDADVFIDLTAKTLLPNMNQAEKWEGLAIGPRLLGGGYLLLAGNDNDFSVTQTGSGEQFDVYVDFRGNFARCVLDDPTMCEVNPAADDLIIDAPVPVPQGFSLLPGLLHAYRATARAMAGYEKPVHWLKSLFDLLLRFARL